MYARITLHTSLHVSQLLNAKRASRPPARSGGIGRSEGRTCMKHCRMRSLCATMDATRTRERPARWTMAEKELVWAACVHAASNEQIAAWFEWWQP